MIEFLVFLGLIVFAIVGLVAIFGRQGSTTKRKFSDGYFYFMAFISLMVLYWGLADLVRVILEKWWVGGISATSSYRYVGAVNYAQEQWLRGLSLRVSAILVSLPMWFFHLHKAVSKSKEEVDESGKRAYSFAFVLVMGLSTIGMLIGSLYLGMNAILGITLSSGEKQGLAFLLPYSIGSLLLWWIHWRMWHESRMKEMTEVNSNTNV
jgi:hypothetical protein